MNLLLKNINALDATNLALIIILLILIFIFSCYLIYSFFKKRKKENKSNNEKIYKEKIIEISKKTEEEIKSEIIENYELFLDEETEKKIEDIKKINEKEINDKIGKIIIDSMESLVPIYVEKTEDSIEIPEELKGRFIGKDGLNIRLIERLTLCQPFINKNENCIRVSSFNSVRKEIAIRLIKKLIKLKSFDRSRIEKYYDVVCNEFDDDCIKIGKKIVSDLNIKDIDNELLKYIGRLNYRTSFKQNVLSHSVECYYIAKRIAKEISINEQIAGECAFFHDIGKSIDFEQNGDHVKSGVELAKKFNLNEYIINSIESHHDDAPEKFIYSSVAKIADKISASRPGARNISEQLTTERILELEKICLSIDGIKKSYVVRNGKEVIVILDTEKISSRKYKTIGDKIKKEIIKNNKTNYWDIKVTVIYEKTYTI